ncbi:hypothetical protein FEM33_21710 [Dyadobacter flavalbus]|uniref:Uncharacterized protein n=1 Tax=Dyadobacter flavalbus TaxID=2579942 RepID=A0A5M8QRD9_9BACT|nr:hypothetical protein [Dyadobacter flavalbus]KAA6436752.1 hypothetical protein FEM33_21710 [Dyadobacter flavalbus]
MKKNTITLLAYGLALMFMTTNCKDDEKPDPLAPSTDLVDAINKIELADVSLVAPQPVVVVESKIETSAQAAAVNNGIRDMVTTGVVPESVRTAGSVISTALSAEERNAIRSVTPEMLAALEKGGELPANLKAIQTKAAANASLSAYFTKVTYPTVQGVVIKGQRTNGGSSETADSYEGVLVSDVCLEAAEAEYQKVKAKLDASRDTQLTAVATQFASDIALLPPAEASCLSALPTKYDALRASERETFNNANSLLDQNQGSMDPELYAQLKTQVYITYIENITSLNSLQEADTLACTAKTTAGTASAEAARDANTLAVQTAYNAALTSAGAARAALAQSCHNQGGGQ